MRRRIERCWRIVIREADLHRPADRDDGVGIEAAVGPDGQLSARPGSADPADRLGQEVGGPPGGVGPALAQAGHEDVAGPGGDRQQWVIAAHARVPVMERALLGQAVRLADRRVEIDRERLGSGSRSGRPGPREDLPADPVELADVTPAEAPQERAQGRGRLDRETQDPLGAVGPQRVRIVDAVATREGRHDERQELVARIRPAGRRAEVEVLVHQLAQAEMVSQRGRQEEPRIGHQAVIVEGHIEAVEAVR